MLGVTPDGLGEKRDAQEMIVSILKRRWKWEWSRVEDEGDGRGLAQENGGVSVDKGIARERLICERDLPSP